MFYLATLPVMGGFGPFHSLFRKCIFKKTLAFKTGWESQASWWTRTSLWKNTFTTHLSSQERTERPTLGHVLFATRQLCLPFPPSLPRATCPTHHSCPRRLSSLAGWTRRRTTAWRWPKIPGTEGELNQSDFWYLQRISTMTMRSLAMAAVGTEKMPW